MELHCRSQAKGLLSGDQVNDNNLLGGSRLSKLAEPVSGILFASLSCHNTARDRAKLKIFFLLLSYIAI